MCSVRSVSFVGPAIAVLLAACDFSDVVEVGSHHDEPARAGASAMELPSRGLCGSGGAASFTSTAGQSSANRGCGLTEWIAPSWIEGKRSQSTMVRGSGGALIPGQYRLERLIEHGRCPCFEAGAVFAQTLVLGDAGAGYVISAYNCAAHSAATFTFQTQANGIQITPTCSVPLPGAAGLFGPFDTYTAIGDVLVLVSTACRYEAEYRLDPVPAR